MQVSPSRAPLSCGSTTNNRYCWSSHRHAGTLRFGSSGLGVPGRRYSLGGFIGAFRFMGSRFRGQIARRQPPFGNMLIPSRHAVTAPIPAGLGATPTRRPLHAVVLCSATSPSETSPARSRRSCPWARSGRPVRSAPRSACPASYRRGTPRRPPCQRTECRRSGARAR